MSVSGAGISLTDTVQFVLEQSSTMAVTALFQVLATSQLQLLDTTVTTLNSVLYLGCTVGHTGLIISGTVFGSASLNVQTGAVQVTGGVVQVRVCLGDSCSTSYSFTNRRLAALPSTRSATTSATQYICASVFGSTTIAVTSGAVLQLDTACTHGTIVDSTNTTVTVSSTLDTSTSTSTTVESGGTIQFVNVSSSSNIVNFNGPLVFASGSCLDISLADTSAITKDVARFVTSSCTLECATVSIENGGDVEYTVTAVAESSTACLIRVSNYSSDNDNGLYFLFLLFLIPVFLAPVVYYYAVGKKSNSTALASTEVLEYEEIDLTGAANFQPSSPYSDFDIPAYEVPVYEFPAYEAYEEPYSDFDIPAYEVPAYEVPAYEVPAYEAYEEPYYNYSNPAVGEKVNYPFAPGMGGPPHAVARCISGIPDQAGGAIHPGSRRFARLVTVWGRTARLLPRMRGGLLVSHTTGVLYLYCAPRASTACLRLGACKVGH